MDIQKEMAQYENILSSLGYGHRSLSKSDLGYLNPITQFGFEIWYESQKAAKAQAVPEGFVLIKDDTKTVVAIERMVEQQVEASGMDSRRLERLDGWKIVEAAVKAQEPAND